MAEPRKVWLSLTGGIVGAVAHAVSITIFMTEGEAPSNYRRDIGVESGSNTTSIVRRHSGWSGTLTGTLQSRCMEESLDALSYLMVSSPQEGSGKSVLLETMSFLSHKGDFSTDMSVAVMFDLINEAHPSLYAMSQRHIKADRQQVHLRFDEIYVGADELFNFLNRPRLLWGWWHLRFDRRGHNPAPCTSDVP